MQEVTKSVRVEQKRRLKGKWADVSVCVKEGGRTEESIFTSF